MRKKFTIALIGEPNSGKSTLFNRLIKEKKSITSDIPGTTRDRIYGQIKWLSQEFLIIDTGGISFQEKDFTLQINNQVEIAMKEADVIVFVVDYLSFNSHDNEEILKLIRQSQKKIILCISKVDNNKIRQEIDIFWEWGLKKPFAISALHGIGIGDLLDQIISYIPQNEMKNLTPYIRFSLVGKPNVGKSSLVNGIVQSERVLVSTIPGTTRDAIDIYLKRDDVDYIITDTAGIKKRGQTKELLEKFSLIRTIKAVVNSDVLCLVVDAGKEISQQDLNVGGIIAQNKKNLLIIVNKWDGDVRLNNNRLKTEKKIREYFKFFDHCKILFTSALEKRKLWKIIDEVLIIFKESKKQITTSTLNGVINEMTSRSPAPSYGGGKLNVLYCFQSKKKPTEFVFFINNIKFLHFSYRRFLENQLRNYFGFEGVFLSLIFRNK